VTQVAPVETTPTPAPEPVPMRAMKLLKNYRPAKDYEVVGWHRPEKKVKDSAGNETIVQTAEFIKGEMAPPPYPGVGYPHKLWAGTVVKLPVEEAKRVYALKVAERDIDD
jgi:hypothetical protein